MMSAVRVKAASTVLPIPMVFIRTYSHTGKANSYGRPRQRYNEVF